MTKDTQIQVRVSLTRNLYEALKYRAHQLGVPVTQLVKFFIIKEVDRESFFVMPEPKKKTAAASAKMKRIFNDSAYLDTID